MFSRLRTTSERAVASTLTIALTLGVSVVLGAGPASAADPDLRFGVTSEIPLGKTATDLVQDSSTGTLFSYYPGSATITVIDSETLSVRGTLTAPENVKDLAVSESEGRLFVANTASGTIFALDSESGELAFQAAVPSPTTMIVDDELGLLWVYSQSNGTVLALDSTDGQPVGDAISVGTYVNGFDVDPTTHTLYVAVRWRPELVLIDETTQQVTRRVPLPTSANAIAVDPESHVAYVGRAQFVTRVDPDPEVPTEDFATELFVEQVIVDRGSNDLLLVDDYNGTLGAMDLTTGEVLLHGSLPRFRSVVRDVTGERLYVPSVNYDAVSVLTRGVPASIVSTDLGGTLQHTVPFTSPALVAEGPGPITWSIVQGTYYGMTIGKDSGVVSGTPEYQATYTFTIRAGNTFGFSDLPITTQVLERPNTLPTVGKYKFYDQTLKGWEISGYVVGSTGYPAPTFTASGLPKGVKMTAGGNLDGKPKETGLFNVRVTAKNSSGSTTKVLPLRVLGYGHYSADIDFGYSGATISNSSRAELRKLARSIHENSTITGYYVYGLSPNTKHKWKDLKRAKNRAWAIAKYLRQQGIYAKPTYAYEVEKEYYKSHSYGWSATSVYYTYK